MTPGVGASTTTTVAYGSTNVPLPGILVAAAGINKAGTTGTPTGYTNRVNNVTTEGLNVHDIAAPLTLTTSGAVTSTYATAANNVGCLIFLANAQTPNIRGFVDEVTGKTTGQTSSTPAATQVGDLNLAFVVVSNLGVITLPAGWKLVFSVGTLNGSTQTVALYEKVATVAGAETVTWAFTLGGTLTALHVCLVGGDSAAMVDASATQANVSSTSVTAASVTEPGANEALIFFGTSSAGATKTWAASAGMTAITTLATKTTWAGWEPQGLAVATGTRAPTIGVAAANLGALVTIKRAPAPFLRSVSHNNVVSTLSNTVPAPARIVNGDLMIFATGFSGLPSGIDPITVNNGLILLASDSIADDPASYLYYKIAQNESGSYTITWSVNNVNNDAIMIVIAGPATINGTTSSRNLASTANIPYASLTPAAAALLLYIAFASTGLAVTTTPPVGTVEVVDDSTTSSVLSDLAYEVNPGAAASGVRSGTASTAGHDVGWTLALTVPLPHKAAVNGDVPVKRAVFW